MRFSYSFAALTLFASLSACAVGGTVPTTDQEQSTDGERALSASTTYVVTRQDFKKCMWPMCSGVYVKAVNQSKTTCLDGTKQADCYVADLDLSGLGLPEGQASEVRNGAIAGDVLLTGNLAALEGEFSGTFAKLVAEQAFDSRTDADATGTYYRVEASGIVCITTPCPSLQARKLNSTSLKQVTDMDFSALGLTDDEVSAALSTIFEQGLVVSGTVKTKGSSKTLIVSQIFDLVQPAVSLCLTDSACGDGAYCDMSVCLSNCPPDMVCPAVCYGACTPGTPPEPPTGGSCVDACGGAAADESCYCDDWCDYFGDCCDDYIAACW
jgi:hypothetical protein